jgi:hypothetical protein
MLGGMLGVMLALIRAWWRNEAEPSVALNTAA